MMKNTTRPKAIEDHRTRLGREKSFRMRAHLLDTILSIYPFNARGGLTVIDDVIQLAGVSRGTFYKHFPSLEEAVAELANQLADEMTRDFTTLYQNLHDPITRSATGFQLFLSRTVVEPKWGSFVIHMKDMQPDAQLRQIVKADLESGVDAKVYNFKSVDIAADLAIGALVEGIKHIIAVGGSRLYNETLAFMMLRGLGAQSRVAERAVRSASEQIHSDGPNKLAWWRPFP